MRVRLISVFVDGQNSSSGSSSSCLSSEGVLMLMVLFSFVVFSASNHICCNCPGKEDVYAKCHMNEDEHASFV